MGSVISTPRSVLSSVFIDRTTFYVQINFHVHIYIYVLMKPFVCRCNDVFIYLMFYVLTRKIMKTPLYIFFIPLKKMYRGADYFIRNLPADPRRAK